MKTKTLSDKRKQTIKRWAMSGACTQELLNQLEKDVKDFIKWCLDNNINQTGTTLVLPLNKFKEKLGDKLNDN